MYMYSISQEICTRFLLCCALLWLYIDWYPKKYAHGFVVLCFVVVMQSFIMNSHEVFIHIHQGCFAGTGAIVRLPQCQWSKPDGYGKISQCITTTKHSKAKTVCIFLGIYCTLNALCNHNMADYIFLYIIYHIYCIYIYMVCHSYLITELLGERRNQLYFWFFHFNKDVLAYDLLTFKHWI